MTQVSVAMSSTGFKFPAHIGVLEALEAKGLSPVEMSGSSGGALISGLHSCGVPTAMLKDWATKTNWIDFFDLSLESLLIGGLVDLSEFARHLDKMTYGATFSDIPVDLKITACNLVDHSQVILSRDTTPGMKVSDAMRASIAIPALFTPLRYKGMVLSDGAIMNTMPCNLLAADGVTKLAARVTYAEKYPSGDVRTPWWIAKRAIYMLVDRGNAWAVKHHAETSGVGMVDIDTGYTDGLNFLMSRETKLRLIDSGRQATELFLAKKEG